MSSNQERSPDYGLHVGDRVKFAEEKQRYTVRAVTSAGRFAICTKPFNPRHTVLYTVVDFARDMRGTDNYWGLGYETDEQVAYALHLFQHTESDDPPEVTNECEFDGAWCNGTAELGRNRIPLRIESVFPPGSGDTP